MDDYDLNIILIAHFADRVQGSVPLPLGQFKQALFDQFNQRIEARLPGRTPQERSAIAVLAFLSPAQTVDQAADMAVTTFIAANS